jgi:hypothetical protein
MGTAKVEYRFAGKVGKNAAEDTGTPPNECESTGIARDENALMEADDREDCEKTGTPGEERVIIGIAEEVNELIEEDVIDEFGTGTPGEERVIIGTTIDEEADMLAPTLSDAREEVREVTGTGTRAVGCPMVLEAIGTDIIFSLTLD